MTRPLSFALTCLLSALWLLGCQADPGRQQQQAAPQEGSPAIANPGMSRVGLEGGKLIFSDDFSGPKLNERWKSHPRAKIKEGRVTLMNNKNEPPFWLDLQLPEMVRVEFDAIALTDEGDIKIEIFGDGSAHQSGYILVYGAHKNKEDWFARLDEHGKDRISRSSAGAQRDRSYHFTIIRTDHEVRWFIDDQPFLSFNDDEPLQGPKHSYFAFNNWTAAVAFDNLQIYDLAE